MSLRFPQSCLLRIPVPGVLLVEERSLWVSQNKNLELGDDLTSGPAPNKGELYGEGRWALRPEELDASGRYIEELQGDGRQVPDSELP